MCACAILQLVSAALVNVSRNTFFSSRSDKKNIFFGVDIVVKSKLICVYRGLYSYRQRLRVITLFRNIFCEF